MVFGLIEFSIHTRFTLMRLHVVLECARSVKTFCAIRALVRLDVVVSIHMIDQCTIVREPFRTNVALMRLHFVVAANVSPQLLSPHEILRTQFTRKPSFGRRTIRRCIVLVDFHMGGQRFLFQKCSRARTAAK